MHSLSRSFSRFNPRHPHVLLPRSPPSLLFPKLWLHPDDVGLFCRGLNSEGQQAPHASTQRYPAHGGQQQAGGVGLSAARQARRVTGQSVGGSAWMALLQNTTQQHRGSVGRDMLNASIEKSLRHVRRRLQVDVGERSPFLASERLYQTSLISLTRCPTFSLPPRSRPSSRSRAWCGRAQRGCRASPPCPTRKCPTTRSPCSAPSAGFGRGT